MTTADKIYSTLATDSDFGELVDMYVEEMPERISALQEVREAENKDEVRRLTHQIKGSAKGYGFEIISILAGEAERSVISDGLSDSTYKRLDQLVDALERVTAGTP